MYQINSMILKRQHQNSNIYTFNEVTLQTDGTRLYNTTPTHNTILEYHLTSTDTLQQLKHLHKRSNKQFQQLVIEQQNIPFIIEIKDPRTYKGEAIVETEEDINYLKNFYETLDFLI